MPSPIGHSLIGLAIGAAILIPRRPLRGLFRAAVSCLPILVAAALLANGPDVDFIPGLLTGEWNRFHHGVVHSVGWVALVSMGVWCVLRGSGVSRASVFAGLLAAVLMSHLVADFLCVDNAAPYGMPLAWPVSEAYFIGPPLFLAMEKETIAEVFTPVNLLPAAYELGIGLLLIGIVLLWKALPRPEPRRDEEAA